MGLSQTGFVTIFCCLNIETGVPVFCIYIPQKQGSPVIPQALGLFQSRLGTADPVEISSGYNGGLIT
jgi:hypothetical protein